MRAELFPELLSFGKTMAYKALEACVQSADDSPILAVDATCGNGHDALFLAQSLKTLSAGKKEYAVLAFDIQEQALESTRALLAQHGQLERTELLLQSHEKLEGQIEARSREKPLRLAAVMYNLGFLPRSDKRVITRSASTLASVQSAANHLDPQGLLSIHAYGGHAGGLEELNAVDAWCAALPCSRWRAARYCIRNKPRAPEALFLVQRWDRA